MFGNVSPGIILGIYPTEDFVVNEWRSERRHHKFQCGWKFMFLTLIQLQGLIWYTS